MIHGELIIGILERASGPLTMGEIEAQPEAVAAKLCREDTQFVLRALYEADRVTAVPGCPGWRYQVKGKSFGPKLGLGAETADCRPQTADTTTTETQSAQRGEVAA